jgi:ferrous iron transport protein B
VSEKLKIALIGNPNTGKSSLFNALTGLNQRIANFPGITVEKSMGAFTLANKQGVQLTDFPGTYSLYPKSKDEAIPFEILTNPFHEQYPHLVIFVADASNLKRNLVLLTQVIDLRLPVVLVLNMIDQSEAQGIEINIEGLKDFLGIPVVAMNARKRKGIPELLEIIQKGVDVASGTFISTDKPAPIPLETLKEELHLCNSYQALLSLQQSLVHPAGEAFKKTISDLKRDYKFDSGLWQREDLLFRYKKVNELMKLYVHQRNEPAFKKRQEMLDSVLTHKVWGYVAFFTILFVVFQAIFSWAEYPMHLIEVTVSKAQQWSHAYLPGGVLNELFSDGILSGLGGVLVFIPQIAFLFFFIGLMEDTGYLARVAFLMDRMMRKFGLNGKSVIPLISGTACAVPAIMATRNIEHRKSRFITILVTPLMSCSARLPVYILLIGLIIPDHYVFGFLSLRGLVLMAMYILGFLSAITAAWVFKLFLNIKEKQYFILEMPVYRSPNWHNVWMTVYKKVKTFVTEAGKIIVAISIILWFLASFGPPGIFKQINTKYETLSKSSSLPAKKLEACMRSEKLQHSYAGVLGHSIEPVIRPLGYDWKIGIAIITSFAAREVYVGTMATLYGIEGNEPDISRLKESMANARYDDTGLKVYTTATVASLLIFYAFALQCMSTIAVTYRETASWKWALLQFSFMAFLAYFGSLLVYNLLK